MADPIDWYYQILELNTDAREAEIEQAYFNLITKWNPDNFTQDLKMQGQAYEKLKEIKWAHDSLVKHLSEKRRQALQDRSPMAEAGTGQQRHSESDSPVVDQTSFSKQRRIGVALVIIGVILSFLLFFGINWAVLIGIFLAGTGLAIFARTKNLSLIWSLLAIFLVIGPVISLIILAVMKKKPVTATLPEPTEWSLRYVGIAALAWALVDAFVFGQGLISVFLCIAGVLHFLPRAITARKDDARFKLRLYKAAITSIAGFAALGMIAYGNVIAGERAERLIVAVEQYYAKHDHYPKQLEELVPSFISGIPAAKYVLMAGGFIYFASDSRHSLMYVVVPPFGRKIYTFEDRKWSYLD